MNVFDLMAKITLDTSDYDKGLDDASGKTSSFASKLKSGLQTAAKVGAVAITAVTTAATAMSAALVKGVGQTASYGDNIDKMSQKLGISAEAYQEWDAIMQHCGSSIESLQPSMKTLANAAADGTDSTAAAFNKLGLSMDEVSSMSQEDLFATVISRLQDMGESTERTAIASDLLGRAATELGPLLNSTSEDTEAMRQRVHELGGVMSNEAVKAAAKYQDTLQDMKTAFSGVTRSITQEFLPGFTDVMDGITRLLMGEDSSNVTELLDSGIGWISTALEKTIDRISTLSSTIIPVLTTAIEELFPYLLEVGVHIIETLTTAIVGALPSLATSGVQIITSLTTSLIELLPTLLDAGAKMLTEIVNGIVQALPSIIDAGLNLIDKLTSGIESGIPDMMSRLPDIITNIINFLTENLPKIVSKGFDLLISLATGIVNGIPNLVSKLPQIITAFVNYVTTMFPTIIGKGVELIVKLAVGLIQGIPQLVAKLPEIITAIVKGIGSLMGNVIEIGKSIVSGIWDGISAMGRWIKDKVTGFFSGIVGSVKGLLGIHSPSKVFAGIGGFMAEGLGEGWDDAYRKIERDINKDLDFSGSITTSGNYSGYGKTYGSAGAALSGATFNITVNGANIQDDQSLAERIAFEIQQMVDRKEAVFGAA